VSGAENTADRVSGATWTNRLLFWFKVASWAFCILILANNTLMMSQWNERRGVYDDLGYLRQAHLFQRFGVGGLDTDARRDDDHFYVKALKDIGLDETGDYKHFVSHNYMPATDRLVLQSPPGAGFLLSLFPEGFQVIPLYFVCSVVVFIFAMFLIGSAPTFLALAVCAAFGSTAITFMINPAKASYSVAPTFAVMAVAGWLTALLFSETRPRRRWLQAALIGLLLGLSVNLRIANLFLASGYCAWFLIQFLKLRRAGTLLEGALFGVAFITGMVPTLVSNAINAGSPFKTTYGVGDAVPPQYSPEVLRYYLSDVQSLLVALLGALIVWTFIFRREAEPRSVAGLCCLTVALNLAFFLTHPQSTQYYLVPFTLLSFWGLLFSLVITAREPDTPALSPALRLRQG
jgi:FtsH-binding integral membrane protein